MPDDFWTDADVISTYSRAEALADGVLVDVSTLAREAGFTAPVAITAGVHALLCDVPKGSGEDYEGRLWDVVYMASLAARRGGGRDRVTFEAIVNRPGVRRGSPRAVARFWSMIGPGDTLDPVITIFLEGED